MVVTSVNGRCPLGQWTSEAIVINSVANKVLTHWKQNKASNTSGRRSGFHFARIGLPKYAFGVAFNTLN